MNIVLIEELRLPPGLGGGGFGVAIFHTKHGVEISSESWPEFSYPTWEVMKPFDLEQLETVIREELAEASYDGNLQDFEDDIVRFIAELNRYFALYGIDGYNREGYDRGGYDREGYDRGGYDRFRFNKEGYDSITGSLFNAEGYDREGYDRYGFDRLGNHRTTGTLFNTDGYDRDGYDREGYDRRGYNRRGYNREGFNAEGYYRHCACFWEKS